MGKMASGGEGGVAEEPEMQPSVPAPVKQLPIDVPWRAGYLLSTALSKTYLLPHYLLSDAITEGNGAKAR